jgi:putative nucleotidyltransferase with HDIG domain
MTSHPGEQDYRRALELVPKLAGTRDLKKILETTVKDLGEAFHTETFQVMLTNPLDPNVTSICEYRAARDEAPEFLPTFTMPLVLHGRTLGAVSLARYGELLHSDEMNVMRVVLGELSDIIRGAQINDIVQRDTFRDTFLVEIGNLMAYSLGIGDALFMVVNILGKALQVSRCLFICTDETQAGWKCYEYWNQDKVQSCQEYRWPTSDSPLIAQVLLKHAPLNAYEGQQNSYVSPVQEELQFIGVKSLLGVPLRSAEATHGCVILQQCDYRRAWTRNEIDMVQNVADKVADALVKLPAEKRAREPIMQLHQRTIALPTEEGKAPDAVSVRNALKGALGHHAIPSARKTAPPKAAAAPAIVKPVDPAAEAAKIAAQKAAAEQLANQQAAAQQAQAAAANAAAQVASQAAQAAMQPPAQPSSASSTGIPTITPVQSKSASKDPGAPSTIPGQESGDTSFAPPPSPAKSLGSILGAAARNANASGEMPPPPPPVAGAAAASTKPNNGDATKPSDPYADLDFGDFGEMPDQNAGAKRGRADATWGNLDAIKTGGIEVTPGASRASQAETIPPSGVPGTPELRPVGAPAPAIAASAAPDGAAAVPEAPGSSKWGNLDAIPSPTASSPPATSSWGDLDSIATPKASPAPAGAWGDLDGIPTPKGGPATSVVGGWGDLDAIPAPGGGAATATAPARGGLSGMMGGKARATAANKPFAKARQAIQSQPPAEAPPAVPEPSKEEAEAAAQAKLEKAKRADATSDYIFATPGLDPRMAGRIFGWIQEIEEKDGYTQGHAKQVAELAVAIAQEAGLSQKDIDLVRQAGLLHDVGKRACPPQILQKRDEELTDPELFVMMRHPIDGADMLDSFQDLKHLAEVVRAHHEEFDGNGYPQGLKGDEIPVAARVVSVANSYHSLVCPMVWGPGMPPQKAQEELVKGAGKQWDPTFVQALIQAIMSKKVPASF